jgi:hypothetical protein
LSERNGHTWRPSGRVRDVAERPALGQAGADLAHQHRRVGAGHGFVVHKDVLSVPAGNLDLERLGAVDGGAFVDAASPQVAANGEAAVPHLPQLKCRSWRWCGHDVV